MAKSKTLAARFWSRVDRSDPAGCWLWTAATSTGYGRLWDGDQVEYAHRISYELNIGPIPDGLAIDHLCHNRDRTCAGGRRNCLHRRCVNPAHLEAVTKVENRSRAPISGWAAVHAARTHCVNGHPLSGDNLIQTARQRSCRICTREAGKRYMRRKRAGQAA
jgi:hypothetical protein